MKKLVTILMSSLLVLGLTACGNSGSAKEKTAAPATQNKETKAKIGRAHV